MRKKQKKKITKYKEVSKRYETEKQLIMDTLEKKTYLGNL